MVIIPEGAAGSKALLEFTLLADHACDAPTAVTLAAVVVGRVRQDVVGLERGVAIVEMRVPS